MRAERIEETERDQRSRRGHRGVVGARKERAANPEANVVGCKEVKDAAMWLGVATAALRKRTSIRCAERPGNEHQGAEGTI